MQSSDDHGQQARTQSGHFYHAASSQRHGGQLGSLASSQQTNETCDESPSNNTDESNRLYGNDSSDPYHYYQVVVPELRDQVIQHAQLHDSGLSISSSRPQPQALSPCRSIQRIVSSLFAASNQPEQIGRPLQLPPLPTLEQKLVTSEPLIRSDSWQNKTLIDLRKQPANFRINYFESSLIHNQRTLPSGGRVQPPATGDQFYHQPSQQFHYQQPDSLYYENASIEPQEAHEGRRERHLIYSNSSLANSQCQKATGAFRLPTERRDSSSNSTLGKRQTLLGRPGCHLLPVPPILLAALVVILLALAVVTGLALVGYPPRWQHNSETSYKQHGVDLMGDRRPISTNELGLAARYPTGQLNSALAPPPFEPLGTPPGGSNPAATPVINDQLATGDAPLDPIGRQPEGITSNPLEHSTQSYWREVGGERARQTGCPLECSQRGLCDSTGTCSCYAGFSGPACSNVDCPNECSRRGECKPHVNWPAHRLTEDQTQTTSESRRDHLESIGFTTTSSSLAATSKCPNHYKSDMAPTSELNRTENWLRGSNLAYDNRLMWKCFCDPGFAGPDCSQVMELQCDDKQDDNENGLIDCEDDDCCSSPFCRDNHICLKSPDPIKVLASSSQFRPPIRREDFLVPGKSKSALRFFSQLSFLIGNDSVQSYALAREFDWSRVALIRGQVTKWKPPNSNRQPSEGIGGVRVSVAESALFGFTLTRADGHFDWLINGDEWVTLQFHKTAYAPVKRRVYVRAHTLQTLDAHIEMWVANGAQQAGSGQQASDWPYGLQLSGELSKLVGQLAKADEQRRASLLDCLLTDQIGNFTSSHRPKLMLETPTLLKTFALVSSASPAYKTKLDGAEVGPLELIYNSAAFPPAVSMVKTTIAIRLLDPAEETQHQSSSYQLVAVNLQLDIEGQWRQQTLSPLPRLIYRFAWNRRNVYGQKVYGFSELRIRVGYEYQIKTEVGTQRVGVFRDCLEADSQAARSSSSDSSTLQQLRQIGTNLANSRRVVWHERRVYLEAHPLNQQADIGKWNLAHLGRLDIDRWALYLGSGLSIPMALVYPPVISQPIQLVAPTNFEDFGAAGSPVEPSCGRLMSKGPNSSMFVIVRPKGSTAARLLQLDGSGRRQLMDLPLSILASKFGQPPTHWSSGVDLQVIYNNHLSTLYLSSRSAAKIVQISLASLLVLNKTMSGDSATAPAEDEIDIEPLCGFGRQSLSVSSAAERSRPSRSVRLQSPQWLALDEDRQLLYFVDGGTNVVALDLSENQATLLPLERARVRCGRQVTSEPFRPTQLHSLAWSKSESALYFVDQNAVLALRPDLSLELAVDSSLGQLTWPFPSATCTTSAELPRLGSIKTIAVDEREGELLIVHQWRQQAETSGEPKVGGRFYLAKMKLGIRESSQRTDLFDLHSPESTWNPMILTLMGQNLSSPQAQINWPRVAERGQSLQGPVPFIHMSNGIERVDAIEFQSDGSIFVLDSSANSIRMITAHSADDLDRVRVDVNRLFATSSNEAVGNRRQTQDSTALMVRNPLFGELMEFHSTSGLHLSSMFDDGSKLDFSYKILADGVNPDSTITRLALDEDDNNDFDTQQLIRGYLASTDMTQAMADRLTRVRLSSILNSRGSQYEFVRILSSSGYAVQTILEDQRPLIEIRTDHLGALSSYRHLGRGVSIELLYDAVTSLLRDVIVSQPGQPSRSVGNPLDQRESPRRKHLRRLWRVVYDKIYNHYCDLFTMDV